MPLLNNTMRQLSTWLSRFNPFCRGCLSSTPRCPVPGDPTHEVSILVGVVASPQPRHLCPVRFFLCGFQSLLVLIPLLNHTLPRFAALIARFKPFWCWMPFPNPGAPDRGARRREVSILVVVDASP